MPQSVLYSYQIKYHPAAAADLRQAERGEMPHESVTVMPPLRGSVRYAAAGLQSAGTGLRLFFRPRHVFWRGCVRPALRCGALFCVPPSSVFPPARWGVPGNNSSLSLLNSKSALPKRSPRFQDRLGDLLAFPEIPAADIRLPVPENSLLQSEPRSCIICPAP